METRSRKRAGGAAAAPPSTRAAKRSRTAAPAVTTRSRSLRSSFSGSAEREKQSSRKGKEKAMDESREREEQAERILGQSIDTDSEDGPRILPSSSALQGLLRKLGNGLEGLLPSSAVSGRLKKILAGLRANDEEQRQIEALTQLCTMLSIGQGESLSPFPVDSFVPVLVGLLNQESNPEMMLLAARALTYLCDLLPSSCSAVVQYGAVSSFCARLLTIEFMDLAEQSLQALKKISQEHPSACLRAGALMAVLSYLDFFPTGVQRLALSTAANICKKLPSDAVDFVMEAVPLLLNLLQHHDSKVLEDASVCLTRITEAFSSSPERLDELCNHGLVKQAADLITVSGQTSLSGPTYTGLTHLLSTCASGSPFGAKTLHLLGISGILKDILSRSVNISGSIVSPDQILEIVNLADELLPVLPRGTKGSKQIPAREELFRDQPELLLQFGLDLLPILIQVHGSSVNSQVRHKCLSVICKLMYFSTVDMIRSLVAATNISSFLASVLAGKDPQVLIQALHMSEILMEKLPEVFSKTFVREGVLHAVGELVVLTDSAEITADRSSRLHAQRYHRQISGMKRDGGISIGFDVVSIRSKVLMEKYFHGDLASADVCGTEDFQHLRNLCTRLNGMVEESEASSDASETPFEEIMLEMLQGLSKEDGVSTFEFIRSGVVASFLNYFSCGSFSKEKVPNANLPELRRKVLRRYRSFISISLSRNPNSGINNVPSAMTVLIQKLQGALSSMESFPLVLSSSSGVLKALTRLRKIQFRRSEEEKSLADFSSNIVVIDPFENLAAVEEFLWPRIQPSDPAKESSSSSSASEKKAGLSAEKGKAVLGSGSDDFVGSRTRSAARRRAKSSPSKPLSEDEFEFPPVEIELMSDDEDIFSEDEDQFHEEMLRDNFIHIYSPDEVHEVNQSQSSASKSSACDQPKLKFFSDGRELSPHLTVIQAIHSQLEEEDDDITFRKSKICTITYQKATEIAISSTINDVAELPSASNSLLDSLLQGELPCNLEKSNGSYDILALLRVLEGINQLAPRLRAEMVVEEFAEGKVAELVDCCDGARVLAKEFNNSKLASKLSKQSKDEAVQMTRGMPPWCKQLAEACPFLFPFEVRREFCAAEMWRRHSRRRQKVRVSRDRVLECAAAVMEVCSSEDCVLDVEFSGEVGTGLGPTLEFYTILSRELQREELGLWRCGKSQGLFPRPWKQNSGSSKVLEYFSLLGRFMGKAIQDGRLLDLPLSAVFYKLVLGQELDVYDVMMFDRELGRSLLEMKALVQRKRLAEEGRLATGIDLRFRGTAVEDLCIDFTLPGYPGYPLREDFDKLVDIESLEEYVELVVDATVEGGIRQQMEAFREGFNRVFDISSLCIFSPEELDCLICGRRELWQTETLAENIKFDHGFTSKSLAIINFLEILGEFTPEQQQAFCQFVTGAPRLPSGGLAALSPKLTVVRKHSSGGALDATSDFSDDLPSVMTCANYLKLPAYSTKEIMYEKLIYAISEGQGSFDLS